MNCGLQRLKNRPQPPLTLGINEPELPRQRRPPRRLDGGAEPHQDQCCEQFYRRIYYSTIAAALSCLKNRFQSPAFTSTRDVEADRCSGIEHRQFQQPRCQCSSFWTRSI